ncbi:MAG: hypothetical protein K0S44_243 [Bacteroidetes bacterium]|jgi:hypothetical protein|nr:hypothetical protein [Bacteroidota bacterium]
MEKKIKEATEFLKTKGIHPIEPIYWNLENRDIYLHELLAEFKSLSTPVSEVPTDEEIGKMAAEFYKEAKPPLEIVRIRYLIDKWYFIEGFKKALSLPIKKEGELGKDYKCSMCDFKSPFLVLMMRHQTSECVNRAKSKEEGKC